MRYWFAPASPFNLGVGRLLFYSGLLAMYLSVDFSAWGNVSDAFWMPRWAFRTFSLPRLSHDQLEWLGVVWKVSLLLSGVGLWTRASTTVSFFAGAYLLGLPHNFGKVQHHDACIVLVLGILALSRCGDALSLDAWRRSSISPTPSGEYRWPIVMIWLILSLIFFNAGLSKLIGSGWRWVASDHLQAILVQSHYGLCNAEPLVDGGLLLAQDPLLTRVGAAVVLTLEVGYPLAMISTRARTLIVPGMLLVLLSIRLLLGPTFGTLMLVHLFWIPWDRLPGTAVSSQRPPDPHPDRAGPMSIG